MNDLNLLKKNLHFAEEGYSISMYWFWYPNANVIKFNIIEHEGKCLLLCCCKITTPQRVTFEYVLIKDINDSPDDALSLAGLIKGIPCKINLIPYNRIGKAGFEPPSKKCVERFRDTLYKLYPTTTIRESRGSDIKAACGQLKAESR